MPQLEKLYTQEQALERRDVIVQAREDAVTERERHITQREKNFSDFKSREQASDKYAADLRQVNKKLVIAGEQAQIANKELEDVMDEMLQKARHDELTELPNRLLLTERLAHATSSADHNGVQLAILFADLDNFKQVNDTFGHAAGDQLLKAVSQRLLACTRKSDTVSRQGGDEFVILLNRIEGKEDVAAIAQKICQSVSAPYRVDGNILEIGITIGICMYPIDCTDTDTLLENADAAMYEAKRAGGNNYRFFVEAEAA